MPLKPRQFFKRNLEQRKLTRKERLLLEEKKKKMKLYYKIALIIWLMVGTLAIFSLIFNFFKKYEIVSPLQNPFKERVVPEITPEPLEKPECTTDKTNTDLPFCESDNGFELQSMEAMASVPVVAEVLYNGKISFYSHAGCLGCNEAQIMGNRKPFDENAFTLAVPCEDILSKRIFYNTNVRVTNLNNGKSVEAQITDCGGFSKYNRVADLSLGLANYLEAKTDFSDIKIELI